MDRLRQRADFLAVAKGARVSAAAFTLQSRSRDDLGPIRVGFTVTKQNGTATERNRIRRRLREMVRALVKTIDGKTIDGKTVDGKTVDGKTVDVMAMRPHHDYVLVGRRAALTRDFATLLEDFRNALRRLDRQPANDARAESRQPDRMTRPKR